jgi:endoribonuclease Dicer
MLWGGGVTNKYCRHNWYPPGLQLLRGRDYMRHLVTESSHNLGEKTIADVCEALIGASLLSGGAKHRFDTATKAVTVFVGSESHSATCWEDYRLSYTKPAYQIKDSDGFERDLSQKIFEKLGYRFKYPRLLRSAFTHPSYPSAYAKVPCYQRLEFMGDALLDMVCVEHLFERFPDKDPQWLTEHKVCGVSIAFKAPL